MAENRSLFASLKNRLVLAQDDIREVLQFIEQQVFEWNQFYPRGSGRGEALLWQNFSYGVLHELSALLMQQIGALGNIEYHWSRLCDDLLPYCPPESGGPGIPGVVSSSSSLSTRCLIIFGCSFFPGRPSDHLF